MAMTASYNSNKDTLKITKGDKGANDLNYNASAAAVDSVAAAGTYGNDAKKIDASALAVTALLNATVAGNVTEIIGGKGADTINVIAANDNDDELNVTLGAGNDVLLLDGTRQVNVSDFSSAGTDSIQLGTNFKSDEPSVKFGAKEITLTFTDNNSKTQSVKLTGGEDKLITITQGTNTLFEQSFQRAAQPISSGGTDDWSGTIYTADNNNTGKNLNVNTAYIDASARSAALNITAGSRTEEIVAGKGADVIVTSGTDYTDITTGKGNDTVQVNIGNHFGITDFTTGEKADVIQLGAGLDTIKSVAVTDDGKGVYFTIGNSTNSASTATVAIDNGLWDQVAKSSTKTIRFVDSSGAEISALSTAYGDPNELVYSGKIAKKENTFDFEDSIVAGDSSKKLGTVVLGTDVAKVTFNTSTALKINAGSAGSAKLKEIVGGKGKDSMIGGNVAQTLYGGKGNDYLFGGDYAKVDLQGDDGNDTMRGSQEASVTGGAGNDVFLLSGYDGGVVLDYYAGTDKATKKVYGSDKLVLANDKWAAKNTYLNARTSVVGGGLGTNAQGNTYLEVQFAGQIWQESIAAQFGSDGTTVERASVAATGFDGSNLIGGSYYIYSKDADGNFAKPENVTIVDQGITYNMDLTSTDTVVSASSSFLGLLTPNVKTIAAAETNKKALRLVAGDQTTAITGGSKADTLVGNGHAVLNGAAGNDIYIVKSGDIISGYSASGTNGKDKIMFARGFGALSVAETENGSLKVGGVNLGALNPETAFTFQDIVEVPTWNAKKGVYTGSKKTTNTMTRVFSTSAEDSILSIGASTYMKTFSGLDDKVLTINGAKKAVNIANGASNVTSIQGSGKVDTISVGANANEVMTVSSGKGNDIIFWDGTSDVVIADYGKGSVGRKVNTGDIIVANLTNGTGSDSLSAFYVDGTTTTLNSALVSFSGSNVILTNTNNNKTLTLVKAKDSAARIVNLSDFSDFDATATVGASDMVTLTNIHEIKEATNGAYDGSADENVTIVDGSSNKKAVSINGGAYFEEMTGGSGADTIVAGVKSSTIRGGSGADMFVFDSLPAASLATPKQSYTIADYESKDKLVFGDISIKSAVVDNGKAVISGKKTTYYSDVTLTLSDDRTIKVAGVNAANLALQVADSLSAKAPVYNMVYGSSDVTITSASAAKGVTINLAGAGKDGKLNVIVDDKRTNAVGFKNASENATVSAGAKAAVTFYGSDKAAVYVGNAKADIYYGSTAKDTVNLGAGANTIFGGGSASAVVSVGADAANVIVVNEGDDFVLQGFSNNGKKAIDKIALDSDWTKGALKTVSFTNDGKDLVMEFASDTTAAASAKIKLQDYTGVGVSVSQLSYNDKKKANFAALSNLSYGHGSGSAINDLISVAGSSGADTIDVYGTIETVTGGAGKDTFAISSTMNSNGITITDYTSADDVITLGDGIGFGTSADVKTLTDYSEDVYTYLGGDDATLKTNKGNIVLQGVGNSKNTGTGAITIGTTKIASLSNQEAIVLTNKTETASFALNATKTFDGSKSTKQLTFTAKDNFTSFKGSNNGDTVDMGAASGKSATLGSGNDNVTLSANKNEYVYTGGTDKFTSATSNGANINLALGSGWSISGATSSTKAKNLSTATINLKGSKNATGSIEISGASDVFTVSYEAASAYKQADKGSKKGGTDSDSDTTVYSWTRNVLISASGASDNLKNVVLATQTSTNKAAAATGALFDDEYGVSASFEERFSDFEEIVSDYIETDDLSEIVAGKADISTTDFKVDTSQGEALKIAPTGTDSYLKNNKKE